MSQRTTGGQVDRPPTNATFRAAQKAKGNPDEQLTIE
jgi:hypothetical protein